MKNNIEWLNHRAQTYLVAANFESADKKEPCHSGLTLVSERYAAIAAELDSLTAERDALIAKLTEIEHAEPVAWKVCWPDGEEAGFTSSQEVAEFEEHSRVMVVYPLYDRQIVSDKREFSVKEYP